MPIMSMILPLVSFGGRGRARYSIRHAVTDTVRGARVWMHARENFLR
jgi:hypothetical protein